MNSKNTSYKNQAKALNKTDVSGSVTVKNPITVTSYKNAVSCRYQNKRISVEAQEKNRNEIVIVRMAETKSDLEIPSCQFEVVKGKVCVTRIAFTNEGLEALHIAISQYLQDGLLTDH